jgi:hypothetical protein
MAETKKAAASEPVAASDAAPAPAVEVDRVAIVSVRADGTPDQCDGFEVIEAAEASPS